MDIHPLPVVRLRQSRTSTCLKVIGGCCLVITTITLLTIIYFVSQFYSAFSKEVRDPHASHLASNITIQPVLPLVTPNTTFDLVFSIWVSNPRDPKIAENALEEYGAQELSDPSVADEVTRLTGMSLSDQVYPTDERLVSSEIVKRGLTLKKEHFDLDLDFEIPLSRL
jgi:hypothetical protein